MPTILDTGSDAEFLNAGRFNRHGSHADEGEHDLPGGVIFQHPLVDYVAYADHVVIYQDG